MTVQAVPHSDRNCLVVGRTQLRVAGLPHDRSNWASGREIAPQSQSLDPES